MYVWTVLDIHVGRFGHFQLFTLFVYSTLGLFVTSSTPKGVTIGVFEAHTYNDGRRSTGAGDREAEWLECGSVTLVLLPLK